MRPIDADLLKEQMESVCMGIMAGTDSYDAPLKTIDDAPTIEPKHGKWIIEYDSWGGLFKTSRAHKCSICNNYLDFDGVNAGRGDANYCPNCGAKMERSESDE